MRQTAVQIAEVCGWLLDVDRVHVSAFLADAKSYQPSSTSRRSRTFPTIPAPEIDITSSPVVESQSALAAGESSRAAYDAEISGTFAEYLIGGILSCKPLSGREWSICPGPNFDRILVDFAPGEDELYAIFALITSLADMHASELGRRNGVQQSAHGRASIRIFYKTDEERHEILLYDIQREPTVIDSASEIDIA